MYFNDFKVFERYSKLIMYLIQRILGKLKKHAVAPSTWSNVDQATGN